MVEEAKIQVSNLKSQSTKRRFENESSMKVVGEVGGGGIGLNQ